jgi:hypothetical protein
MRLWLKPVMFFGFGVAGIVCAVTLCCWATGPYRGVMSAPSPHLNLEDRYIEISRAGQEGAFRAYPEGVCEAHHVQMFKASVPIKYGFGLRLPGIDPWEEEPSVFYAKFPHSRESIPGGCVNRTVLNDDGTTNLLQSSPQTAEIWRCDLCCQARIKHLEKRLGVAKTKPKQVAW